MFKIEKRFGGDDGHKEAVKAYKSKHGRPLPQRMPIVGRIFLADGSSPVPNFRAPEAFLALVALAKTGPFVRTITTLGTGGTNTDYAGYWNWPALRHRPWERFYEEIDIMDRVPNKYSPVGYMVFWAVFWRRLIIGLMWLLLFPWMGKLPKIPFITGLAMGVFELSFWRLSVSELAKKVTMGKVVMKVPCPLCSYQQKQPVYHAVRSHGGRISISKNDRSSAKAKCKGAGIMAKKLPKMSVWQACFDVGARVSGLATYALLERRFLIKPTLLMRNYSNPRGTMGEVVRKWSNRLSITSRFYLYKNGQKVEKVSTLFWSILLHPRQWSKTIKEFNLLSDGDELIVQM